MTDQKLWTFSFQNICWLLKLLNTDKTFKYQSRSMLVFKSQLNDLKRFKNRLINVNQISSEDSLEFINMADLINLINFIKERI